MLELLEILSYYAKSTKTDGCPPPPFPPPHAASLLKCYDSEEDMLESLARKEITQGMVVVIRYEGPKGGPGMPEMLTPSSAIMGAGLGSSVALITDGRFSGGSHG